jgi:hypothetical protein
MTAHSSSVLAPGVPRDLAPGSRLGSVGQCPAGRDDALAPLEPRDHPPRGAVAGVLLARSGTTNSFARVGNVFGDWRLIVPGLSAGYVAGEIAGNSQLKAPWRNQWPSNTRSAATGPMSRRAASSPAGPITCSMVRAALTAIARPNDDRHWTSDVRRGDPRRRLHSPTSGGSPRTPRASSGAAYRLQIG